MNNFRFITIILLLIGLFIWIHLSTEKNPLDKSFFDKIDKLELKIDSINSKKDSITTVIDSTHIRIIENEHNYKETVRELINMSDSESLNYFKAYIKAYKDKL